MSFILTDTIFSKIHSAKDKDARIAMFADAFEVSASDISTQYDTMALAAKRGDGITAMRTRLLKYSIPKTIKMMAVTASALGCSLTVTASGEDVTISIVDPSAMSKGKGKKGASWRYFIDGAPLLKRDGGKHANIKALLTEMATAGDASALDALKALTDSQTEGFKGWRLNGWTAAQKMPSLKARITRSR